MGNTNNKDSIEQDKKLAKKKEKFWKKVKRKWQNSFIYSALGAFKEIRKL